ncbi:hypothetical protein N0V90_012408 [Kalmusia sp. IMI 367209]|nr:hypothetical protein N0V90_012408 [Kalmusia sp. IMI 367209]
MTFNLDHSSEVYVPHVHNRLSRRQDESTSVISIASTQTTKRPTPTASEPPPDSSASGDLSFQSLDSTFELPGNKSLPFDLGCRNCTGTGKIELKITNFEFNNILNDDDDLVKTGAVEIDLTGFSLSIGLKATPEDDYEETINIFTAKIIGADLHLEFSLDLDFQSFVNQSVELGFGFDVTVPDSKIRADIAETQNSGITGFNPNVTAQLLRSNISDVEVWILAGLQPKFTASLEILDIDVGVGPFLSLPHFVLNATQLHSSNVGANCETNGDTVQEFKDSFTNITHVEYNVGIGGGLEIDILGDHQITFASTDYQLATQCLVYKTDGPVAGLAEATSVLADLTKPPEPTGKGTGQEKGTASSLVLHSLLFYLTVSFLVGIVIL